MQGIREISIALAAFPGDGSVMSWGDAPRGGGSGCQCCAISTQEFTAASSS